MSENSTTSSATVMRLNVNSSTNGIVLNNINSFLKTVSSNTNQASLLNSRNNSNSNVSWKLSDLLNSKEANNLDTCFKGENLQQISTNALAPYVPGSPTNVINLDASSYEFHCCTDCGDTFALKSSLVFHLDRRSVLIKFYCDACKSVHIFYNRCKLLSHVRSHTDKNETADISKATVNPLPRILFDGMQSELNSSLDDEALSIEDTTTPSDLLECSFNVLDSDSHSPEKATSGAKKNLVKIKCMDCNEEFNTPEERAQHLTQGDKPPVMSNLCNKCSMVCPSKCFLKAHQRIHLQVSPYVCPECGGSPNPVWMDFQYHVKFVCFHNARGIGYKCPVCKRLCSSNDTLLKHMESHTEKYAKCNTCPRAYMNIKSFNAHIKLYHTADDNPKYNMIYKCSLCDVVFLNQEQMMSHRPCHLKEQVCEYVFSCMQCGKPHGNKKELFEHIKTSHPKISKYLAQTIQRERKTEEQVNYVGKVECLYCNSLLPNFYSYKTHLSKIHGNYNQFCASCYVVINNREDMLSHGKKHISNSLYLCLLCNNKKWNNEKQLDDHLKIHAERVQNCTFCPICDVILRTSSDVLMHLREEHELLDKMDSATGKSQEIFTCHFCRDTFVNDADLQDHVKTKHLIEGIKRHASTENEDNDKDDTSKKARFEGNICAKCDFHSIEREDFKKHILTHKTNKSSFQCQECGLCFIVEPTLVKHLKIIHKISDTKKYIEEEGTNCLPDFESQAEVSTCNSLICNVCFTTFPNESSLKTHMRSHGMAFIQAAKSNNS